MASRARGEERRGGRTGRGKAQERGGASQGRGGRRTRPIRYISFLPFFFFLSPRGVGVETHETSRYRLISSKIRGKFEENSRKILRIIGLSPCHRRASLYLYVHGYILRYRERKGERETGSEGDGSTHIHVGGGEERRDENKGGGKKKRRAKFAFGIASGPRFDDRVSPPGGTCSIVDESRWGREGARATATCANIATMSSRYGDGANKQYASCPMSPSRHNSPSSFSSLPPRPRLKRDQARLGLRVR